MSAKKSSFNDWYEKWGAGGSKGEEVGRKTTGPDMQSFDDWSKKWGAGGTMASVSPNVALQRQREKMPEQKSYAQQKYEEAVKRVEEKEKGKFRFGTAAKDAGASVLTGAASGFAATGAMLEDLAGGALDTVFKGAGFKGRGLFNTLYNGDTPLAQALRNVGLMDEGIKKTNEYYQNQAAENAEHIDTGNEKRDKVLKKVATGANEIAYGVGNALPMAAGAMLGAPAAAANGLAAVGADGLIAQGARVAENSGMLQTLSQQARAMLKDKDYWTSFAQEVGMDYNEALEDGATEAQAAQYAVATALLNAGIEIGSPAEKSGLQNMAKPLWKSALEEGKEEIEQGPVGRLMKNVVYGKNAPIFSTTDEDAVINPAVMAKEFGMGAAVGGLLGGGQRLVGNAAESMASKAQGNQYRKTYAPDIETAQALVDEALAIDPNNKTALKAAERLKAGKNISGGTVTQLVEQNERMLRQNAAAEMQQEDAEAVRNAARAQNAVPISQGARENGTVAGEEQKVPAEVMAQGPAAVRTYQRLAEANARMDAVEQAENMPQKAAESAQARFDEDGGTMATEVQRAPQTAREAYMQAAARYDGVPYVSEEEIAQQNAEKYGEDAKTYLNAKQTSTLSAAEFDDAWSIAYAQGAAAPAGGSREGYMQLHNAMRAEYTEDQISDAAIEFAYELGREGVRGNERTESGVREGGQWNDGARADGQAGGVEERAGQAKDGEAKHLKGRSFRKGELPEGVKSQATVQMVTEGETKCMKRARAIGEKRGMKVHFFRGGDLQFGDIYANGCICDGEVWIRADDPEYTADQIMRHEAKHDAIEKGEVNPYEEWQKLEQRFGVDRMDSYVEAYAEAVAGMDLSEAEIEEEILCDAAGGMNKFEGKLDILAAEFGEVLDAAGQETTQENSERGPPEGEKNTAKTGGVKGSIVSKNGKQYVKAARQVLTGSDAEAWAKQIENYINEEIRKGEDVVLPTSDNHLLILTERSAYKMSDRHVASIAKKVEAFMSDESFSLKGRIATHIDEMIKVAKFQKYKADEIGKHENDIGEDGFNYYDAYFEDFDGKYYRVRLSAALNENQETAYSIGKVTERKSPASSGSSSNEGGALNGRSSSTVIIRTSGPNSQEVKTAVRAAFEKALAEKGNKKIKTSAVGRKAEQLAVILENNPVEDDYHTWIRSESDILTLQEAIDDSEWDYDEYNPDWTRKMAKEAIESGTVTVYSSKPITKGGFVSPSKMEAESYSGTGKVYSKRVAVDDVAWIDPTQGQYAPVKKVKASAVAKDSKGRKLSEQQAEYFRDSKVRDKDGNLLVMYHQTEGEFTVFDTRHKGAGTGDDETPFGVFLKTSDKDIGLRGKNQMELYANIKRPLMAKDRSDLVRKLRKLSDRYAKIKDKSSTVDEEYSKKHEEAKNALVKFIATWRKENPEASRAAIYEAEGFEEAFDAEDNVVNEWTAAKDKLAEQAKDAITNALRENGYDGVVIEEDVGSFGRRTVAYIALEENQVKNVDNTLPTEDPDIRFSATGTAAVAALEEQNNALKEQVRQLNREKAKLQKQVESKTAQVNKWKNKATFSPERVGRDIIKAYQSTVAESEIHDNIESLIAYASKEGSSVTYGRLKEMAAGIADKIVRNAATLANSETKQEYDAIKEYHKRVKLEVTPELKRDFTDWGDWWKDNGRKLHVVNGARSNVDMIYAEMREQFGEGYYPADIINPADQLRRMTEVLDNLSPVLENPHSYNIAYATEACANDLADMVMQEVARGYAGTITYQLNEKLYRVRQEARELAQRAIKAESERGEDARAQIYSERVQRWETEEKRAARKKIASTVRTLDRALRNPTDNNHIPDELRGTVQELCSIFTNNRAEILQQGEQISVDDHAIFDAEKLAKARAYYGDLKEAEGFKDVYDEETAERLKNLEETIAGKRLSGLTLEELRDVKAVVEHIRFVTRTADEMFINGRKSKIQSVAQGIMIGADMKGTHEEITLKDGKGLSLKRMIAEGNLKPEYFFRRLGDSALSNMWHDILNGQNTYAFGLSEAKAFREKVDAELETGKWMDSKKTLKMKDAAGRSMEVNMGQAMYMVAAYKRERLNGNTNHVLGGGFVFEEEVVKDFKILGLKAFEKRRSVTRPHTMNEQTMEEVEKWLTEQDSRTMQYVDRMVAYLSNEMAEKGNETSMRLHGYKKFLEKFYIPMQSASEFLEKRFDSSKTNSGTNYKNKGMTKRTTQGANNPIVLREFDEVWAKHVNEMLLYNAMAVQQDNLQRIMNYKTPVDKVGTMPSDSVRAALTEAYGGEAVQYVDTLMKDINGGLMTDSREAGVNSMISLFKKNAVFASMSVAIQQPSSIARAMAVLDGKYLVQTVSQKRDYEELKKYSGVAIIKEIGGFDTTTGRSGADWLMDSRADKTAMEKLDAVGGYLPGKMDEVTWGHIWNAVKAEIADTTDLEVGSEKYFERCGERFNEVIELTQVYDSVLTRSENMRSQSGVLKIATSFMAEPTVTLNMVAEAVHNVREKKKDAWGKLFRTMGAVLISILLNNMLKAIVTAPRDKDKDKNILEKYAGKFASGVVQDIEPWNYVPLVKDLSEIWKGYSVEVPYWQTFENAYKGVKGLWDDTDHMRAILNGDTSGVTVDGVADAVNGIAGLFGIPAKNVWRDTRGIVTLFKETAPIKDASFDGVVDAAWEEIKGSKSTSERVEDYFYAYRGKSAIKQRHATKDMEKLWQSKYKSYLAKGYSEKEAKSKANSAVKSSVTQALKPKYQAAKTQAERNRIIEVARHLYLGDRQLYAGYNFTKEWAAEN